MFKTDFKKKYGEFLKPYGYTYCTNLNRFVKLINNEILMSSWNKAEKPDLLVECRIWRAGYLPGMERCRIGFTCR